MVTLNCFFALMGKKKKDENVEFNKALRNLQMKRVEQAVRPLEEELKSTDFIPPEIQKNSPCTEKLMSGKSLVQGDGAELAYQGEDEHEEENSSIKREFSDFDLQAHKANSGEEGFDFKTTKIDYSGSFDTELKGEGATKCEKGGEKSVQIIQSGHVSDPEIGKADFWASPQLERSCSGLETRDVLRKLAGRLPQSKSQSFEELQQLSAGVIEVCDPGSPASLMTSYSADKVILKKGSSSQILPSRSRNLWWKLFLWSHRNLQNAKTAAKARPLHVGASLNQQGGYHSDTFDPNMKLSNMESPTSFTGESVEKDHIDNYMWDGFQNAVSSLWHQKQWVVFAAESSCSARVDEWVRDLETHTNPAEIAELQEEIGFQPSDKGKSSETSTAQMSPHPNLNLSEEVLHANNVIQSLNFSSTVAYISGIGLKAIPSITRFSSLRSVDLSNNWIAHITPGSLPNGLLSLNLSRNKISTIEGLRELTRLRVLDLSYNRISRMGHGLSNCRQIKELNITGNKISDVEGLHRLLKLTILDLSFNKITTIKALGQLVGNYESLQALNLLGNPIQSSIGDAQLRKAVCSLLPNLAYLNKQPIKPQRAREVLSDSVAKVAMGRSSSSNSRKKAGKRASQGESTSSSGRGGSGRGQNISKKVKDRSIRQ